MQSKRDRRLKWGIPILLFISIIIDSALPAIFPREFLGHSQTIVPHLTLYLLVTFAFYFRDSPIMLYAFLFGLLSDVYNVSIIGLYATAYTVIVYLILKFRKQFPKKAIIHFMLFIVAIFVLDFAMFVFYREVGLTTATLTRFLANRLGPTIIFNTVLMFILYWPTRSLVHWLGYEDYIII